MRIRRLVLFSVCLSAFTRLCAQTTLYWDTNGATAGTGNGGTNNGTWGTDDYWTTDSNGTSATTAYVADSDVDFSAGTNNYDGTVTLSSDQSANSLTFQNEGNITLSGHTLTLTGTGGVINVSTPTVTINSTLAGSVGLTVNAATGGTKRQLNLGGTNTYTGGTLVNVGRLAITNSGALSSGAVTVTGVYTQAYLQVDYSGTLANEIILNGAGYLTSAARP